MNLRRLERSSSSVARTALLLVVLVLVPACYAAAQAPPIQPPIWTTIVDGPFRPYNASSACWLEAGAGSIGTDADGGIFVVGAADANPGIRYFLARYDPDGSLSWVRWRLVSFTNGRAPRIAIRPTGEPRVAVLFPDPTRYEVRTYSSTGAELWRASPDPGAGSLRPLAIGFDAAGEVVVASHALTGVRVERYGGPGPADWQIDDTEIYDADGAHVTGDGVVIWGGPGGPLQVARYVVGGGRSWLSYPATPAGAVDRLREVVVDPGGRLFGAGSRCSAKGCAPLTISLDAQGGTRWSEAFDPGLGDVDGSGASAILLGAGGEVYVGGAAVSKSTGTDLDAVLLKYSVDGALDWARMQDRGLQLDDRIAALSLRDDGVVQAVGSSRVSRSNDGLLVATVDPSGAVSWSFPVLISPTGETACDVASGASGALLLAGDLSGVRLLLGRLDAAGAPVWVADQPALASPEDMLGGGGGGLRKGGSLAAAASGEVWLAARSGLYTHEGDTDPLVVHLASDGTLLGTHLPFRTEPPPGRQDHASSVVPTDDGGALSAGFTRDGGARSFVEAVDADLNRTEVFQDDQQMKSVPNGLFRLGDGTYRLIGSRFDSQTSKIDDLALDQNLVPMWRATSADGEANAQGVDRSPAGDLWVTGVSYETDLQHFDCHTVGFAPDGSAVWEASFGQPGHDESCSSVSSEAGRVVIAGASFDDQTREYLVASYDAAGNVEWSRLGELTPGDDWTLLEAALLDPDGDVFLVGRTVADGATVARLAPDGSLRWASPLGPVAQGYPTDAVLDDLGFLYVVTNGSTGGVAKLDPEGNVLWTSPISCFGGYSVLALDPIQDLLAATGCTWDLVIQKFPGSRAIFVDSFETGDTSRWSGAVP